MAVRFGIVGAGAMARAYAQAIVTEVPDGELVAVGGGSRAPEVARDYDVECEPTPEVLYARDDVDAVIIATPHSTHMPLTIAAARAGLHVFVEKPMARTVAECDAMLAACREAGVLLAVNKLTRYRDSAREAKIRIDRGDIGEVRMLRAALTQAGLEEHMPALTLGEALWFQDPVEGSSYLDWGCHGCDLFRWLAGADAVRAFAQLTDFAQHPAPPFLRSGMAQYTFASGAIAQLWYTSEIRPPGMATEAQYLVIGSEGTLDIDAYGKVMLGKDDRWELVCEQPPIDYINDPWNPNRIRGWARQTQEFAECVLNGGRPGVTGEDGRAAIEMVEAAERSSATGEAVALPLS